MRLSIVAVLAASCLFAGDADAGVGHDRYGTREPATCASRTATPNAQTAAKYLACDLEHESGDEMYLISDVHVQVAPKGRPFNLATDSWSDIDPARPVYNIRGSFRRWQCGSKSSLSWENSPGKACNLYDQPQATGTCYMDNFGDWHCHMLDVMHNRKTAGNLPPPN